MNIILTSVVYVFWFMGSMQHMNVNGQQFSDIETRAPYNGLVYIYGWYVVHLRKPIGHFPNSTQ